MLENPTYVGQTATQAVINRLCAFFVLCDLAFSVPALEWFVVEFTNSELSKSQSESV